MVIVLSFQLCLCLLVLLPTWTTAAPVDILSLLLQAEGERLASQSTADISISVAYHKAHLIHYGAIIDGFLGPRPWWVVKSEPFHWHDYTEGQITNIILSRLPSTEYDSILESISQRQYPSDCSHRRLRVSMREGFDSFGNVILIK